MKIEKNVLDFLDKASSDYGSLKAENFSILNWGCITYGRIESPIEQIYYIAFKVMSEHFSSIPREFTVQPNDPCELVGDPYKAILETLIALGVAGETYLVNYNKQNPFGIL